jgi:hypothetical protein
MRALTLGTLKNSEIFLKYGHFSVSFAILVNVK